ncbi:Sterol uptake control protein 2-like protein 9 [Colletotrichum truncatum]|uniref:Sterol uptake control protein 2-like protein 9 n=1 Tax=Colletotrichum truncatum TaxID=5467 RepID=A0ACC3YM35_COLTU
MPTTPTYPPPEDQHQHQHLLAASSLHAVPPSPFLNPEQFGMLPLPESPVAPSLPLSRHRHTLNGCRRRRLSTSRPRRARGESPSSVPCLFFSSFFSTLSLGTPDFETFPFNTCFCIDTDANVHHAPLKTDTGRYEVPSEPRLRMPRDSNYIRYTTALIYDIHSFPILEDTPYTHHKI